MGLHKELKPHIDLARKQGARKERDEINRELGGLKSFYFSMGLCLGLGLGLVLLFFRGC